MSFLSILPMLLVFAFFQKYFVEGVARTGLK
jgi:ABC-type glycerol-3-phosphate transport system permease component